MAKGNGVTDGLEALFHKTVKKVTSDIEELKFNTAVASLMTLLNEIEAKGSLTNDELATFVKLLSPFAPHLCEEIWEGLGNDTMIAVAQWPEYDEAKTVDSTVEIAVQFNGKLKGTVVIAKDADKDTVFAQVHADERFAPLFDGKTVVKEIYVPGKIVNVVVK